MAGRGPTTIKGQVTPNRRTHIICDDTQQVLIEPAFSFERMATQMARTSSARASNVIRRPAVGWRVANYFDLAQWSSERTEAQSGYLTQSGSSLRVASGVMEFYGNRAVTNTELPTVQSGGSGSVATQSVPKQRRGFVAGANLSTYVLSADQTAFPSPDTTDANYVMDRIASSAAAYAPGIFVFEFEVYGIQNAATDGLFTMYFPGPAGKNADGTGNGQYALKCYGTGRAKLFERKSDASGWIERMTLTFAVAGAVFGNSFRFAIESGSVVAPGGGVGGFVLVRMGHAVARPIAFETNIGAATVHAVEQIIDFDLTSHDTVYKVPIYGDAPASQDCQLRVDVRRDLRGIDFWVAAPHYFSSGYLIDDFITTPGLFSNNNPFTLEWKTVNNGGSIDAELHYINPADNSDVTMTPLAPGTNNKKMYAAPSYGTSGPPTQYYVKFSFTATATASPYLQAFKLYRSALYNATGTTPFEIRSGGDNPQVITKAATEFSIIGPDRDITHETATIHGADLLNNMTVLRTRSFPVRIETEYDSSDSSKRLILFDGIAQRVDQDRLRGGARPSGFPVRNAYRFTINANGPWQRLQEQNFVNVLQTMFNYSDGLPFKATDMVKAILQWAGYPDSEINIPDSPIRLWGKNASSWIGLEPYFNAADVIQRIMYEYLGWTLIRDYNAGSHGKWRAIQPSVAPYTNVCAFLTSPQPQSDSQLRLASDVTGYPLASTLSDGLTYKATAPVVYISNALRSYVVPPEANMVHVTAVGQSTSAGANTVYSQTLVNPKSYNFYPDKPTADPTNPDYLGRMVPLYYMNPSLAAAGEDTQTLAAVTWIARRLYDVSCLAIKMSDFEAPLVPLVHEDDSSRRRTLRYYDPVSIDGQQYLIRNYNPAVSKDSKQMAMVQVQSVRQ